MILPKVMLRALLLSDTEDRYVSSMLYGGYLFGILRYFVTSSSKLKIY